MTSRIFLNALTFRNVLPVITVAVFVSFSTGNVYAESTPEEDTNAQISILLKKLDAQEKRIQKLEQLLSDAPANDADVHRLKSPATTKQSSKVAQNESPLEVSGDLRLRYEHNNTGDGQRNDSRGAIRARIGATYLVSPDMKIGGRLATGDPDDPNSSTVSLSNFNDDLQVSFDQFYAIKTLGNFKIIGGKFANPFRRTDLLWDGDVNPQGAALQYATSSSRATRLGATTLFFPIERSVAGPDSYATGYQLTVDQTLSPNWELGLAAAYYDYEIEARNTATTGDTRSNRLTADGDYVSDFDIFDVIADVEFSGFGERWPLHMKGEYVQNFGAENQDTAYSLSASFGQTDTIGSFSANYAYNVAESDAVFAAFSQDNIPLATNYKQHTYAVSYALNEHVTLNTTLYAYRVKDPLLSPLAIPDWQQRLRLNFLTSF